MFFCDSVGTNENSYIVDENVSPVFRDTGIGLSDEQSRFIEALRYISGITISEIMSEKVNSEAAQIARYVSSIDSCDSELKKLFGFVVKDKPMGRWEEHFRDMEEPARTFFIAELKLKAGIFLLRADNFIQHLSSGKNTYEMYRRSVLETDIREIAKAFGFNVRTDQEENEETHDAPISFAEWLVRQYEFEPNHLGVPNKAGLERYLELCKGFVDAVARKDPQEEKRISEEAWNMEQELSDDMSSDFQLGLFDNIHTVGNELPSDVGYYIFDNSMNEVQFVGIEHYWIWRYERDKQNLFRCVGSDDFRTSDPAEQKRFYILDDPRSEGRFYYQKMIANLVTHMNKGRGNKLASYSKDPWLDIFKYMSLPFKSYNMNFAFKWENGKGIYSDLELEGELNTHTCTFAMVKNADVNIVKQLIRADDGSGVFSLDRSKDKDNTCSYTCRKGGVYSFSELVNGKVPGPAEYMFCVDVLNNYAPTTALPVKNRIKGSIRSRFYYYTSRFPDEEVGGLQNNIVAPSDMEVVMMGNTCDAVKKCDGETHISFKTAEDNVEYRVELGFKDIVGLFWRLACVKYRSNGDDLAGILGKNMVIYNNTFYGNYVRFGDIMIHGIYMNSTSQDKNYIDRNSAEFKTLLCRTLCSKARDYAERSGNKLDMIMDFVQNSTKTTDYKKNVYITNSDPLLNLYRFVLLG